MYAWLLVGTAACSVMLNKIIHPGERISFTHEVLEADQQWSIGLTNLTKDRNLVYKIVTPDGLHSSRRNSESSEMYNSGSDASTSDDGERLTSVRKVFYKPGTYSIEVHNTGRDTSEFQISSYTYKKVNETNKDVLELRNLLYALQNTMDTLGNENYYLQTHQKKNLEDARALRRSMNWLILFPVLTVLVGYLKYFLSRQMVKPKGKRFKGLF